MSELGENLKKLMEAKHGSLAAFARAIGVPQSTIYSFVGGPVLGARLGTIVKVANELELDLASLAEGRIVRSDDIPRAAFVPVFGSIAAGQPIEPDEADGLYPIPLELHERYPRAFLLRIVGTSMNRVFPDGSLVLVDPCSTIETSGQCYALTVGDGLATVKRVRLLENGLELQPDSDDPTHHAMVFDRAKDDAPTVSVIGRVTWHCNPV